MTIKISLLKSGEQIISDIKEAYNTNEQGLENFIGFQFEDPYQIILESYEVVDTEQEDSVGRAKIKFLPWLTLSKEKRVIIPSDWVVTLFEPLDTVKESYLNRLGEHNGKNNSDSSVNEQSDIDQ